MARFTLIETGKWQVPRNEVIKAETPEIYTENRRLTIPGFSVLIQDKKIGNILWDTGITEDWKETWPEEFKKNYTFEKLNKLEMQLQEIGLTVDDIDLLICSHLHYDHAGNIKKFKNTKAGKSILISEAEAQEAFLKVAMSTDGISGAYFRDEIIMNGIGYELLKEDQWISDDIFLFIQRGHTPGVIGLIVKTDENGNVIFTSDAVYSSINLGPPIVLPGLCIDPDSYKENIERLHKLQKKYDAKIIFGHDIENFKNWNKIPYFYE